MVKQAAELQQWDVIRFRRSGERNFKTGFVWDIDEQSFGDFHAVIVTVTVNGKNQLLNLTDSTEWSFQGSMNPDA